MTATAAADANRNAVPLANFDPGSLIQISYSDLSAFHQCPRRYYYEKRLRMGTLPDSRTTAVRRGTVMHTLLEGARDRHLDEQQAAALFAREGIEAPRERAALLHAARRILESPDYAEVSAGSNVRRERQFYLPLHDSDVRQPVRFLKGYIDIQSTRADGSLLILDYKSGTRAGVSAADYEDQARCYALVGLAEGHPSVEVRFIRPEVDAPESAAPDAPESADMPETVSAAPDVPVSPDADTPGAASAPQIFSLGPYTPADYDAIEANLIAAIHEMEQTNPASPCTGDIVACKNCPLPPTACPHRQNLETALNNK